MALSGRTFSITSMEKEKVRKERKEGGKRVGGEK